MGLCLGTRLCCLLPDFQACSGLSYHNLHVCAVAAKGVQDLQRLCNLALLHCGAQYQPSVVFLYVFWMHAEISPIGCQRLGSLTSYTCTVALQIDNLELTPALREALEAARAAAEAHASLAAQRSSSGTGEMLRSNFVVVADHVEAHDGHLLAPKEKARTAEFKVWMRLQPCLHCKQQV